MTCRNLEKANKSQCHGLFMKKKKRSFIETDIRAMREFLQNSLCGRSMHNKIAVGLQLYPCTILITLDAMELLPRKKPS
jgi:hypothetical protein